jgi:hypothetical protein
MTIKVVNRKKKEPFDIYIGRPSKWGNPFVIGKDGTREEVIIKYRKWLLSNPELLKQLPELNGKTLGCWCKPLACHGDVIKEVAEEQQQQLDKTRKKLTDKGKLR